MEKCRVVGRVTCALLLALLGLGVLMGSTSAGVVYAQAQAIRSNPGPNVSVQTMPDLVTVYTSESVRANPDGSNIFVYGPHGTLISQGNATVSGSSLSVPIGADGEGAYVVQWKTISAKDGKAAQGAFTFTYATEQNNFPLLALTLTGIVMLVMGILMGYGLGRRKAASPVQIEDERELV